MQKELLIRNTISISKRLRSMFGNLNSTRKIMFSNQSVFLYNGNWKSFTGNKFEKISLLNELRIVKRDHTTQLWVHLIMSLFLIKALNS